MNHFQLIRLGQALGYRLTERGMCAGFTKGWNRANAKYDERTFYARLKFLEKYKDNPQALKAAFEQLNNPQESKEAEASQDSLSPQEKSLLRDIHAFFALMARGQVPNFYENFFLESERNDLSPQFVEDESPDIYDVTIHEDVNYFDLTKLKEYLSKIAHEMASLTSNTDVNIILNFQGADHIVGVKILKDGQFEFLDTNGTSTTSNIEPITCDLERVTEELCYALDLDDKENKKFRLITSFHISSKIDQQFRDQLTTVLQNITKDFYKEEDLKKIFLSAAYTGNSDLVSFLLENKNMDVEASSESGDTALMWAVAGGRLGGLDVLLKNNADVNQSSKSGETALMHAARRGYLAITNKLLENKAEINLVNNRGESALMLAAENGHTAVVKALLAQGAIMNNTNMFELTPLMSAAINGHLDVVIALMDPDIPGARIPEGWTEEAYYQEVSRLAEKHGHRHIVQFLKDRDPAIAAKRDAIFAAILRTNPEGSHPKDLASYFADDKNKAFINAQSAEGLTPLIFALVNQKDRAAEILIRAGANPNAPDQFGETPLIHAARLGNSELVRLLLEAGADADLKDSNGKNAAYYAAVWSNKEALSCLIQKNPFMGYELLVWLSDKEDLKILDTLLDAAVDREKFINIKVNGKTALMLAAEAGNSEMVSALLDAGALSSIKDNQEMRALHWVAKKCTKQVFYRMLRANITEAREEFLVAIANGEVGIVNRFLDNPFFRSSLISEQNQPTFRKALSLVASQCEAELDAINEYSFGGNHDAGMQSFQYEMRQKIRNVTDNIQGLRELLALKDSLHETYERLTPVCVEAGKMIQSLRAAKGFFAGTSRGNASKMEAAISHIPVDKRHDIETLSSKVAAAVPASQDLLSVMGDNDIAQQFRKGLLAAGESKGSAKGAGFSTH